MYYYTYDEFAKDFKDLAKNIDASFKADAILAVARGGMSLAHCLALALNNRQVFVLNSIHYDDTTKLDTVEIFNVPDLSNFKTVLIVDDVIDSGESMKEIKRLLQSKFPHIIFKVATVFKRKHSIFSPDFVVRDIDEWVVFHWDIKL